MRKTTIKKYTVIIITAIFIITSFIPVAGLSTISRIDESSFDGSEEIIIPEITQANSKEPVVLTLKWYNDTVSGRSAVGPLVADVTGNGKMEIIRSGENGVVVLDGETGTEIWNKTLIMNNDHCPVEIIDLNKDDIPELILSNDSGTITLHGNNGSVYWYNEDAPLYNKYCVAGDIDADGYPEIFNAIWGQITALTHDGVIFATTYTYYPCFSGLSLGDTDQDGVFELYLNERSDAYGSGEGLGVRAFWASNLTERWNRPDILCSSHCPTLVDVDGDGKLDVVSLQQSGGGVIVLNSTDGSEMHYTKNIPEMGAHSQPTVHDVDNDGNLEIIVSRKSVPVIWDLVEWKTDAILPYKCKEPPAVADITGDGNVEIIACTDNNITIFNNKYEIIGTLGISNAHAFVIAQDVDNDGLNELIISQQWLTSGGVYVYDTIAPAPTPRALSQYQFYSPHRGRSPYFTQYGPSAPVLKDETPSNGAMNYSINPMLSVYIYDYQQDEMNITFSTNASGTWQDLKNYTNVQNGTHTAPTSNMSSIDTIYWWRVTVTDSTGHSRSKIYSFETTRTRPVLSNPSPKNGEIFVGFSPTLSIDANCYFGPTMNIEFWTNASGTWSMFGSNLSVINGTFICDNTSLVNSYFTKYWWSVNASDLGTGNWTNKTYYFTTEATKVDAISPYEHISSPISISASGSSDLDNVSLYYRYSDKNWTNDRITLTYDSFEGESFNWGNWSDAGSDCKTDTSGEYAYDGNNSLNLEDDSSTAFTQLTNGLDLDTPGYTQIIIDFWAYYTSIESGESLEVFFDRTSVWTFYPNSHEDQFIHHTIWINETDYEFGSDVKVRFEAEFSAYNDDVYLDQIHIQATNNTAWIPWNTGANPDQSYPWSWNFNFPNGTGYYEFFSSGMHKNIVYDAMPDYPDAICNFINQIPTITSLSPFDNEVDVSISLSDISFTIIDDQTDSMDYTITTIPDIIGGSQSDSNVESGSIINIPIITSPLQYETTYSWTINLTDGMYWNNQTYRFTTRSAPAPWWDTDWQYRQEIIVDQAKVVGDLINFPIFINIPSDSHLKDHAQPDGDDIVFIDSAGTILNHEIEHYDSNTGTLIAWVNVSHLSSASNTILYLYYGNSDAPNQENIEEVWDADYVSVHHFQETSGLHQDSTAHDNDTTVVQVTEQGVLDGIAGGCDMFNGSDYIQFPTKQFTAGKEEVTIEVWINPEIISNRVTIYDEWNEANYWQYTLRFDNFNTRDVHGGPEESRDNDISWIISQPTTNTWNYVTTWYSVAVEEKRLYFNGSVDTFSYTNIDVLTEERNESSPRLGFASDGQNFTGKMDEFRVSKIARSTEWLKTTYNTMSSPHTFLSIGSEHTKDIYLLDENPSDYATDIEFNPLLSIFVEHPSGKAINVSFMTNASSGIWHQIGSTQNGNNNTYYQPTTNMDNYSTDYFWSVNCTDQEIWVNRSYHFTTITPPNNAPILSNENPSNGSTDVNIIPKLNVTVDDPNGDVLTAYWYSNSSDNWTLFAINTSISTSGGAINISQINTNFSAFSTIYYWSVNLTDSKNWTNETYHFTTEAEINNPPVLSGENPENGSIDISIVPKLNVTVDDFDGDELTAYWYSNSSDNWMLFATNFSIDTSSGAVNIGQLNSNFSSYSTPYWWSVNITDGLVWTNETYWFRTENDIDPNLYNYSISLSVGWNIVSLPVNQSFDTDNITVNYLGVNSSWDEAVVEETIMEHIYGWNASIQNYDVLDIMHPGQGYWVYANKICDLWISSNINYNDDYITDLLTGWNLVGLPYNKSVDKENLTVSYNGLDYPWEEAVDLGFVIDFIFGWDTDIQNFIFIDILANKKGYWIYTNVDCTLLNYQD